MKPLAARITYYLKLYCHFFKFSLADILVYRTNAFLMGLAPLVWLATMLIFIQVIFSRVGSLGGWTLWEVVFLTAIHELLFTVSWIVYGNNLGVFEWEVKNGQLDKQLVKPMSARFLVSFRGIDFTPLVSLLSSSLLMIVSLNHLRVVVNLSEIIIFIVWLALSFLIVYNYRFLLSSLCLFFVSAQHLSEWAGELGDFNRYPADIYHPWLKFLLMTLVPVLYFSYIPASYFLGKINSWYFLWTVITLLVFSVISGLIWRLGLRHYQSASS
jgi:ABC-2 type transport system permease protein